MQTDIKLNFKTLQDDATFKNVFSHQDILNDLMNSFFNYIGIKDKIVLNSIEIQKYMLPNNQSIKAFFGDLICILNNGYIISLEMFKNNFTKRDYKKSFSYLCKLCFDQMKNGQKNYENIKKVIGISFIKGNFKRQNNNIVNSYSFKNTLTQMSIDDGDIELHLIRLDLVNRKLDNNNKNRYNVSKEERFIKWLRLINAESIEELKIIGKGDKIMENLIQLVNEWVNESSKNGLENYIEQREYDARLEEKKEVTKNMLNKNVAIEDIIEFTGLTKKEVMAIKKMFI